MSVWIGATARDVYAFAADGANLPTWAAGLAAGEVRQVGDRWQVTSPMGPVGVEFAPRNDFGVLDHTVALPTGVAFYNPMRVIPGGSGPDGTGCEVVFTVRRRAGMTEAEFDADAAAVAADLDTLRGILERR